MLRAVVDARGSTYRAARELRRAGVIVPDFAPDLAPLMDSRSAMKNAQRTDGGWIITAFMLAGPSRAAPMRAC